MKLRPLASLLVLAGLTAQAQTPDARVAALEKKVDALSRELERQKVGDVFQEVGESAHGLAPSASKVYAAPQRSLSIGGYGEAIYQNFEGDKTAESDFLRAILYTGYKFSDQWLLNTEIEFEHATTGGEGEVSVEFAYLDYLHTPALNFRAGLLLVPMGLVNQQHEPTLFNGVRRPDVESRIIPSTWRENGAGVHGEAGPLRYEAYVVNGFDAQDFTASGLRDGRQKGSKAKSEDLGGVVRIDVAPTDGLMVGGSFYQGDSGQDLDAAVGTTIFEGHAAATFGGLSLRGLATVAELDDVAELNRSKASNKLAEGDAMPADSAIDSVGERMTGWYVEAAFDLLSLTAAGGSQSLSPFVRYEEYNTQDEIPAGFKRSGSTEVNVVTVGVNYQPLEEIIFKADYQFYENESDSARDQFNLGLGYVF